MLGIVLGTKVSRPTAKLLAHLLGTDYSENFISFSKGYKFVFRYGNSYTVSHINPNWPTFQINEPRMIQLTSNKAQCRRLFLEHGIRCPQLINNEAEIYAHTYPIIARPYFHSRGKKFYVVNQPREAINFLHRGFYLQELIQNRREYRVFMYNGRFFECCSKEPTENTTNFLVKNHGNGWHFKRILVKDFPEELKEECRNVFCVTHLNWMAIDCCLDGHGIPYIFEANSAPGLIERKAIKLAEKIVNDFNTWEKGNV